MYKMTYYDDISEGYDELHKEEQLNKLSIISQSGIINKEDYLLDVGCGTAFSLDYFEIKHARGIDPSHKLVEKYSGTHEVRVGSAENLPFEDASFDIVLSVTAIQNFEDVKKGLEEIKRVGKDKFALTYLKKSLKSKLIDDLIKELFSEFQIYRMEEEKDVIFLITK